MNTHTLFIYADILTINREQLDNLAAEFYGKVTFLSEISESLPRAIYIIEFAPSVFNDNGDPVPIVEADFIHLNKALYNALQCFCKPLATK